MPSPFSQTPVNDWLNLRLAVRLLLSKPRRQDHEDSCYIPGVDNNAMQTKDASALEGPVQRMLRQVLWDDGVPVSTFPELVTALTKVPSYTTPPLEARTLRVMSGVIDHTETIEVGPTETLTLVFANDADVTWTINPALAGPAFQIAAGGALVFVVQPGSNVAFDDNRGGPALIQAQGATGSSVFVFSDVRGGFRYVAGADGAAFMEVAARNVDAVIQGLIRGAEIEMTPLGVGTAPNTSFVRVPAGAGALSRDGFDGSIIDSTINAGTILQANSPNEVQGSDLTFSRRLDVAGVVLSSLEGGIVATPANQPPVLGDERSFVRIRGAVDESDVSLTLLPGPGLAAFKAAEFQGNATNSSFVAAGAAGAVGRVELGGSTRQRAEGMTFDLTGLAAGAQFLVDAANGLDAESLTVRGAEVLEISGPALNSVRARGVHCDGCGDIRISHPVQGLDITAGALGGGPYTVSLPGGVDGLRVGGPGADVFNIDNSQAGWVVAPWNPVDVFVTFRNVTNALAAGDMALDGVYRYEVVGITLPLGATLSVGTLANGAEYLILRDIVATGGIQVITQAPGAGARGYYANLSQPGTPNAAAADFFHALAAAAPQAQDDFNNLPARTGRMFTR